MGRLGPRWYDDEGTGDGRIPDGVDASAGGARVGARVASGGRLSFQARMFRKGWRVRNHACYSVDVEDL